MYLFVSSSVKVYPEPNNLSAVSPSFAGVTVKFLISLVSIVIPAGGVRTSFKVKPFRFSPAPLTVIVHVIVLPDTLAPFVNISCFTSVLTYVSLSLLASSSLLSTFA